MPRFILGAFAFALFIYAVTDWFQTINPKYLSKAVWFLVIVFVPIFGPLLWIIFGRTRGGGGGWGDDDYLGPEDDPVFWKKRELV